MLIQDFVQVDCPYPQVAAAMLADAKALFRNSAEGAYHDGEQLTVRMTPSIQHPRFGKRVHVDIGEVFQRDDGLVLPIQWWAAGAAALFPRLEADLEVAPLGAEATQLTLMGRYDPPMAGPGRQLDRFVLHRVAEASVRSFLVKLAASLECSAAAALTAHPGVAGGRRRPRDGVM